MRPRATDPKIKACHTSRLAILYIRRSSLYMVREHTASGMHQRSFKDLARAYGWEEHLIIEVDEDDGRSATDTTKRKGFQWLRQQIFENKVGAIFCWEASRLSRDIADFTQFIKLCGVYETLIIDEKAVYNPNDVNDNASLGIQGVMNQAESRRTGNRSKATKRTKAEAGELLLYPPTGYVYDDDDNLVIDPREEVQKAIRLVFSTFDKEGSATRVVKHFNRNDIKFPTVTGMRVKKSRIELGEVGIERILAILHNPLYAGTFTYGRSKSKSEMLSADTTDQKSKRIMLSLDSEEVIVRHGSHEGYITWEKFMHNQKILEDNRYKYAAGFTGAAREGSSLLQGLIVCGSCHAKLKIEYSLQNSKGRYVCKNKAIHKGKYTCLGISSPQLDQIVTGAFLEAVSPAQLRLTLQELGKVGDETRADDHCGQEELTTAKAECDRARRVLDAVDPEDTLVVKEYGKKLQEKLLEVERLEKKYAKASKSPKRELTKEELRAHY